MFRMMCKVTIALPKNALSRKVLADRGGEKPRMMHVELKRPLPEVRVKTIRIDTKTNGAAVTLHIILNIRDDPG